MADNTAMNGVESHEGDRSVEISGTDEREEVFVDFDENGAKAASGLMIQKIEALEQEKRELVHENDVVKERINKLKEEIKGLESDKAELKREVEQSVSDKRALESISARAYDLETEVSRLQHELITAISGEEEAGREVNELKREVEELKKSVVNAELFDTEREMLLGKIDKEVVRARKLEEKIDEKEDEIRKMKKSVEEEMERVKKEREELEGLLRKAERKGKVMEEKVGELRKELEVSERMISGLREKVLDGINGKAAVVVDGDFGVDREKGLMGLKVQWPVVAVAGATGAAIATVAVLWYVRYSRER